MAWSPEFVRKISKVYQTKQNRGVEISIKVTAYDNGHINVNGVEMSTVETGWNDAHICISQLVNELQRNSLHRRIDKS